MSHQTTINETEKRYNWEAILAVFMLLDICLFPYIRQFKVLSSMLLVAVWYVIRLKSHKLTREFWAMIFSVLLVVASICVGYMILPATVPSSSGQSTINVLSNTVTYSIIYLYTFLFFFFFRRVLAECTQLIYKVVKVLYVIIVLFALMYLASPELFYQLRSFWSLSGRIQEVSLESSTAYRYTFSFSDPNNIGALVIAITILMVERKTEKKFVKYAAVAMCAVVLLATMSTQAIISFAAYFVVKGMVFAYRVVTGKQKVKQSIVFAVIALGIVAVVLGSRLLQNEVVARALSRMSGNEGSMGTRLNIWSRLLQGKNIFSYLLCGTGCTIILDGKQIQPHNGHLYIIYAFGFIAYACFIYVFFWKKKGMHWKDMLFLIPLFICFSINVGLIDARYTFAMAAVSALGYKIWEDNYTQNEQGIQHLSGGSNHQ